MQVHTLSAYEFARHYHFKIARHPQTMARHQAQVDQPELYHATLTDAGLEKIQGRGKSPKLVANKDYQIREPTAEEGWLPLGTGQHVDPAYRHDWIIVPRKRPNVPVPYGAPGSKSEDEQAKKILLLFFPWVNDLRDASPAVPFVGNLWTKRTTDWRFALRDRAFRYGFPTDEVKRFVLNFCVVHFLPRGLQQHEDLHPNSDDEEAVDDVDLDLNEEDLTLAALTHVRGAGKAQADGEASGTEEERDPADPNAPARQKGTTQFDLTMGMFQISSAAWLAPEHLLQPDAEARAKHQEMLQASQVRDHGLARKAAAASKKQEEAHEDRVVGLLAKAGPGDEPWVKARPPVTRAALEAWLDSEKVRRNTNAKQIEMLRLVVDRILVETGLISSDAALRKTTDPLLWLLHGPPGTGKSHVLGFVKELFDMMGYTYGLDYEVATFQAVNAADLGGKTMHKAFGWKGKGDRGQEAPARREAHKRMAHWRWLILDEISLVDAKLLGQAERDLREVVPANSPWKNKSGKVRPFAGLNVIFTGDFHQLPPPAGIYLADVPRAFKDPYGEKAPENALGDAGKQLFWGGAVQGVTELQERERCKDEWWNEVVDELRAGQLSDDNWRYLHGYPVEGCTLSEEERQSRRRVVTSPADPRLQEPKFRDAMVVVANNDARYQINKDRARRYSQAAGAELFWSVAQDQASSAALQADDCSREAKIRQERPGDAAPEIVRTFNNQNAKKMM